MAEQLLGTIKPARKKKELKPSTYKRTSKKVRTFLELPVEDILRSMGRPASAQEIAKECNTVKTTIQKKLVEARKQNLVRIAVEEKRGKIRAAALWEAI